MGKPFPDILYDGVVDKRKLTEKGVLPEELRLCIRNNGGATFANIDAANDFATIQRELAPYDCALASPEPVMLTGGVQP